MWNQKLRIYPTMLVSAGTDLCCSRHSNLHYDGNYGSCKIGNDLFCTLSQNKRDRQYELDQFLGQTKHNKNNLHLKVIMVTIIIFIEEMLLLNFKVEYRAGTKRKPIRSRLLVHKTAIILYATHNNSQPKKINDTSPVYNIGLVLLIYLGWELLCVAYITVLCVQAI